MTRALTTATKNAAGATITAPGFLIELRLSTTYRFATRGDVVWNSITWAKQNLQIGEIVDQPDGSSKMRASVGNTDLAFGAVVLAESQIQGAGVSVWFHYDSALALADPVKLFEGVVNQATVDHSAVSFEFTTSYDTASYLPRRRITREAGFNRLLPAGRVLQIGAMKFRLERR